MGQRHQIYVAVKNRNVKTEQDEIMFGTKETTVFAYHHQWLYGRSALFMAGKVIEMADLEYSPIKIGYEFPTSAEMYEFMQWLLMIDNKYHGGEKGSGYHYVIPLLKYSDGERTIPEMYRNYIDRGDNNDGITILDIQNRKYCFMFIDDYHGVKKYQPLTAQQYVDTYYPDPSNEVKRFINLAVKSVSWELLTMDELHQLFPKQEQFKTVKKDEPKKAADLTEYQKGIVILENKHSRFEVDFQSKSLDCYDLDDKYNDTKGFNRTSRSIKKAWAELVANWTDEMRMYAGCQILSQNGIRMHTYCGMD